MAVEEDGTGIRRGLRGGGSGRAFLTVRLICEDVSKCRLMQIDAGNGSMCK